MIALNTDNEPVERVKISITENQIDLRVHYFDTDYQLIPTLRGFSIPLASVSKFIQSLESVEAYALSQGV